MSRWFRHYAGMMRDEKLVAVAIRSKQPVERVTWIWGAILESAAEIDDAGRFEIDAAEVAYFLRADEADICAVLAALAGAGRVAEGCVVKWGDRQYQSDKSAERQARYRARRRSSDGGSDDSEEAGDVTPPSRDAVVTPQETETEAEEEVHPSPPSVVRPPQKSRGQFLPQDWKPCPEGQRLAIAEIGSRDAALRELEKFRNYWFAKSGADGRKRDWEATWRNWIMRAADDGKRNGNHQRQHRPASGHDNLLAAMDELLGGGDHGGGRPPGTAGAVDAERDAEGVYQFSH